MKKDTRIVHAGSHPENHHGAVNPPVYRVSTVVHGSVEQLEKGEKKPFEGMRYGRFGTPTTFAFEEAMNALEGGYRSIATASGLAAITGTLMALLKSGDHLLMVDTAYQPTRRLCDGILKGFGIETTYYDPLVGAGIKDLIRPNTRVVFVESPGSLTFEVQDVPAIAEAAHAAGALVVGDNTWGTPINMKPFALGMDVSIQACTKYVVGHADAMLGCITAATEELWHKIKSSEAARGVCPGTEELYLGLRGLRTLSVRLRQHQESGVLLAHWLLGRPEVARVLHPALPSDPGHALWRRDFSGACGLFGIELKPVSDAAVTTFLDALELFGLGYSWGGFESLCIPTTGHIPRTATTWRTDGPTLRFHIGLEDPEDLKADITQAFEKMRRTA